jgi:hypothetical protein
MTKNEGNPAMGGQMGLFVRLRLTPTPTAVPGFSTLLIAHLNPVEGLGKFKWLPLGIPSQIIHDPFP